MRRSNLFHASDAIAFCPDTNTTTIIAASAGCSIAYLVFPFFVLIALLFNHCRVKMRVKGIENIPILGE